MKVNEMRELTDPELEQQLDESRDELFKLRVQHSTTQADDPLRIRVLRREVARILSIKNERRRAASVENR